MDTLSSTNPLFARLTRNAKGPSLRATLLLSIGLSLASILLAAYWLSNTERLLAAEAETRQAQGGALAVQAMTWETNSLPPTLGAFLLLPGALLILTPVIVILAAILVAAREVGDKEAYQLLHLALPPRAIVRGLMLTILHRVRILCALTFVLMPFLVISPYQKAQAVARYGGCYMFMTPNQMDMLTWIRMSGSDPGFNSLKCANVSDNRFLLEAVYKAARPAIVSWGISLLGLVLAVGLMLWWRRASVVLLFFGAIPFMLAALSLIVGPTIGPMTRICTTIPVRCLRCGRHA